ncbi:unnamed protein product [Euphydryas editha]|uniref:Uncharacterized protein n=1 Tax=Euphydryas editha TaxID=104508 RepID=A0AAU9UI91_EUPED|nr:unnamed protein product [Euphydryas editha]
MKINTVQVLILVFINVVVVRSECDSYFECLGSFFDNFFVENSNFNVTEDSDVVVPGFDNVYLEEENLRNILSDVSSFLKEELGSNHSFGTPINIYKNIDNKTSIYVKTITIDDALENIDEEYFELEPKNTSTEIDSFQSANTFVDDSIEPYIELNEPELLRVNEDDNINYKLTNYNVNKGPKRVHENEIHDTYFEIYDNIDDNSTDYPVIDYIDLYKDTTNEYIDINPTETPKNFNEINYEHYQVKDINTIREKNENNGSIYVSELLFT